MIRRLAFAIVRRYPAAWRERYEAEVCALIEDSPTRLRDLGELLRGLLTERARELMAADNKPKRTAAVLVWMPAVFLLAFTLAAIALGLGLQRIAGPLLAARHAAFGVAVAALMLVIIAVEIVTRVRHNRRPQPKPAFAFAYIPAWVACLLLPFVFVAVVAAAWGGVIFAGTDSGSGLPWQMNAIVRGWLYFIYLGYLTANLWPGRDLLQALGALEGAERALRMSETWAHSCREWIEKGVPSPLDDALKQIGRWTIERDAARARLRELGYGSRFKTPPAGV